MTRAEEKHAYDSLIHICMNRFVMRGGKDAALRFGYSEGNRLILAPRHSSLAPSMNLHCRTSTL